MTKTLPGSVGPARQVFRRPGAGRAVGERPGQVQMDVTGPLRAWSSSTPRSAPTGARPRAFPAPGRSTSAGVCPTTPTPCRTPCPVPRSSPRHCARSDCTTPTRSSSTTRRASIPVPAPGGCCAPWASTGPPSSTAACPPGSRAATRSKPVPAAYDGPRGRLHRPAPARPGRGRGSRQRGPRRSGRHRPGRTHPRAVRRDCSRAVPGSARRAHARLRQPALRGTSERGRHIAAGGRAACGVRRSTLRPGPRAAAFQLWSRWPG
jgi:hypothetical protein